MGHGGSWSYVSLAFGTGPVGRVEAVAAYGLPAVLTDVSCGAFAAKDAERDRHL